ncbi:MAG: ATP-binding cassette domain-containing protein [Renibacterium salmoninarum]|nr:ATP-binding cassette domain-containing protein [Renibacterium salmoninarum]
MDTAGKVLELQGINRSFSGRQVLDDVGLTVRPGRMTGFVGANGAGKTTTMRIILGVLTADSGSVTLDGQPLVAADRRRFGYMPEERGLYPKMKVAEQLGYFARLHGLGPAAAKANTKVLLERLGLAERAAEPVEKLSLGNQQRVQVAAALVHDPEVLILDEPFSGLDPVAVETVQTVLTDYAARGVPVLFSSHQLDIVERICDDVAIIARGSIRANGEREALRAEFSEPEYEIQFGGDLGWLSGSPGLTVLETSAGRARFRAEDPAAAQQALSRAVGLGPVISFAPSRPSLADIFKEIIQ